MIFDIILILMLIVATRKASNKGCTEDMHFVLGFFIIVRLAGAFYTPASKIVVNFITNQHFADYSAYALIALIVFFIVIVGFLFDAFCLNLTTKFLKVKGSNYKTALKMSLIYFFCDKDNYYLFGYFHFFVRFTRSA